MSSSPESNNNRQPSDGVSFHSGNIGKWAAKQENPFAEQNRKAAEKKAAKDAKKSSRRKKTKPILKVVSIVLAILVALGLIAWLIVFLVTRPPKPEAPTIDGTSESISNYRDTLQEIYDKDDSNNLQNVVESIDATLDLEQNQPYRNQIILSEILFYMSNGMYGQIIERAGEVDPDSLDTKQQIQFYNAVYYAYSLLDDEENADKYQKLSYEAAVKLNGGGTGEIKNQ